MVLLIVAWGSLLLSQEHINEKSKQRQWMRKRVSMGASYAIFTPLWRTIRSSGREGSGREDRL